MQKEVKAWTEAISIPTYGTGKPEKNPMFLEKRVYQGSSGVVYPHPVIEKILDEKKDRTYQAVFLENHYLKIMILPELGGRVYMAYDKIRRRHFIYYNQVIKPALVGLTGPWISGGIEFNWPQHHRPSTFLPVDYTLAENSDGSKTVWVNEVEIMFRTKGMAGFTLYPDKAYLEIQGKLSNRTPFPQTFLWWANPAVKVNEQYQSVFPPDVHAVFDHGKRDVSSFPVARGTYYKVNYAPGTDISRYKNIPVPTSYMAVRSEYDFIGGYEHDTQAGILHVADHHISPGKKQWTWGNGDFGRAWDRNLTDEDGPYIELMTGVFTDNQPDFSWLQPHEEKTFVQYFMPYSRLGMVKNATREALVSLDIRERNAEIKVYATALYDRALIRLSYQGEPVYEKKATVSPEQVVQDRILLPDRVKEPEHLLLEVKDAAGRLLVCYRPEPPTEKEIPPPAAAAPLPADVRTNEELYLHGLHLEQYRHATYDPREYYLEALKRDPADSRNNQAMGLWHLRRGKFAEAAPYFRAAVKRLTMRNPNPYDAEPYYHLGCTLKFQGHLQEAYTAFYKATWNAAWQDSAFLMLARIDAMQRNFETALGHVDQSLSRNTHSHQARHLKAALLRRLGKNGEALPVIAEALEEDPFNYGCLFEKHLIALAENQEREAGKWKTRLKALMHDQASTYIEYALDYAHAGLHSEAIQLLRLHLEDKKNISPLVWYHTGWFSLQLNAASDAARYFSLAAGACPDFCFPNRIEDMLALEATIRSAPGDAKAFYYLGNYWYDKRLYKDAVRCWEQSAQIDPGFPTVFRNLSLSYYNKQQNPEKALQAMEKAFVLDTGDARVLMELDQLRKLLGFPHRQRLDMLEAYLFQTEERDDLYLERATLYNQLGDHETARRLIAQRKFHPWEGGEGKVVGQYLLAHIEPAREALQKGDAAAALELLGATEKYPENLGEGKLFNTPENDIHYLQGCAYELLDKRRQALEKFKSATTGNSEPVQAIFYNDPQPDKIFYQGLAWKKLGEPEKAEKIFSGLRDFGQQHLQDSIRIDYFAVSLPDLLVFEQDLDRKNRLHCHYLIGLGCLGLGREEKAITHFRQVLEMDINHQGAAAHLKMTGFLLRGART